MLGVRVVILSYIKPHSLTESHAQAQGWQGGGGGGVCGEVGGGGWRWGWGGRLVPSQLANSLGLYKSIETMASTGQSKICIFWQKFSHWIFYI